MADDRFDFRVLTNCDGQLEPFVNQKTLMAEYRVYIVTDEGQVDGPPALISCENDEDALRKAKRYVGHRAIEIWAGSRRVAAIPPVTK